MSKNANSLGLLLTLVLFISGCSSTSSHRHSQQFQASNFKVAKHKIPLHNKHLVKRHLMAQYRTWKGTPYRYGGTGRKGIDCSAFVQRTFGEKLGYAISRTTRTQVKQGKSVSKNQLQIGDIVFFRTGNNSRHNGIYLGKSQFMHASSSRGVTISNLNNAYWKKHYWTARRL